MTSNVAHVVAADGLFDAVFRQASAKQVKSMMGCFLDKAALERQNFQAAVNNQLQELRELMNALPSGGGISDTRLETLFRQLMQSPKMAALFNGACQVIEGVSYSNASIIKFLVERPQIIKKQYIASETDPLSLIGAKLTLTGNREVMLTYSEQTLSEVGVLPRVVKHTFSTDAWPTAGGVMLAAEAYAIKEYYSSTYANGCTDETEVLREQTDFVFEMSGTLAPCPLDGLTADLDINGDGTIGDPAASGEVQPMPPEDTGDTGTGDTGTGDTGTGDTGTGDTGTGDTGTDETQP